jgi:hypothetical protein
MLYASFSLARSSLFRQVLGISLVSLGLFITVTGPATYHRKPIADLPAILSLSSRPCISPECLRNHHNRRSFPLHVYDGGQPSTVPKEEVPGRHTEERRT